MRLVDQRAAVGGSVEYYRLPPRRKQRLVITPHAFPCRPRQRRLDQGISEIAKLALVVGQLELRGLRPMLAVASAPSQRCMSSLRISWRVRPKSPPLQLPEQGKSRE
jgi:hypothetical protein